MNASFYCKKFHCTLTESACLSRQKKLRKIGINAKFTDESCRLESCGDCAQGVELAEKDGIRLNAISKSKTTAYGFSDIGNIARKRCIVCNRERSLYFRKNNYAYLEGARKMCQSCYLNFMRDKKVEEGG